MADPRPLRVAQLITTLARGGAQATVLASRQMSEHGVDVTILAGPDDPGEGTHWRELAAGRDRVIEIPTLRRALDPVADLRTLYWLVGWLRSNRPDVLHTHSSKAGVLGRVAAAMSGVPVVHTVHGWSFAGPGHQGLAGRIITTAVVWLERLLARLSGALIVVTPLDADQGVANRIGHPDQYRVVRSGVDLDRPRSGRRRREHVREQLDVSDRFVVGTVGRLAAQKDLATLVEAFALAVGQDDDFARDATLLIVGDGPDRQALETLAERNGVADRTVFLGQRCDAAELVAAFDTFALTSRWEGLPRTLVEAMAASVPVVATPVGGIPELVRNEETGLLVDPGEPRALAVALQRLHREPELVESMTRRADDEVGEFSDQGMRQKLGLVWSELAVGPS